MKILNKEIRMVWRSDVCLAFAIFCIHPWRKPFLRKNIKQINWIDALHDGPAVHSSKHTYKWKQMYLKIYLIWKNMVDRVIKIINNYKVDRWNIIDICMCQYYWHIHDNSTNSGVGTHKMSSDKKMPLLQTFILALLNTYV